MDHNISTIALPNIRQATSRELSRVLLQLSASLQQASRGIGNEFNAHVLHTMYAMVDSLKIVKQFTEFFVPSGSILAKRVTRDLE